MDRKFLLTSTAVTAFASTGMVVSFGPALAADPVKVNVFSPQPVSGYVQAYFGIGQDVGKDGGSTKYSESVTTIGGAGRLKWWLSPTKALQADAWGSGNKWGDGGTDEQFGLALHWAKRDPNRGALGLLLGVGQDGDRFGNVAVQGQIYNGSWTIYGQAGVTWDLYSSSDRYPYLFLQARYFTNPDTVITGDVTVAPWYSDAFYGRLGLGIEHKLMTMPVSLFGRAQAERIAWSNGATSTLAQILVGAKLWVNQNTLLSNDRNGATFLDANPVYGEFSFKY